MKYYIYISDTKVDMLYPQIPKPILKKIASSLSIDLKLFGAELSVGAKNSQANETRYSKVRIVSEYIEKHLDVGTIDTPSTYFRGNLLMQWGPIYEGEGQAVFFGGRINHRMVALTGSMHHVIDSNLGTPIRPVLSYSNLPNFSRLLSLITTRDDQGKKGLDSSLYESSLLNLVAETIEKRRNPMQQVEFLAKTLLQGPSAFVSSPNRYVVLGTPIYVAIDD